MATIFTTCDQCGRNIYYGNAYVSIARNIEQIDYSESKKEDEVQIIDSELIILLCAKCGNGFHYDDIRRMLRKNPVIDPGTEDLLEKALSSLTKNLDYNSVNFKSIGHSRSLQFLAKKSDSTSAKQPGIMIEYDKNSIPVIYKKYRHIIIPMSLCEPLEIYNEEESIKSTNQLLLKLTKLQIDEIQAFFDLTNEEVNKLNNVS